MDNNRLKLSTTKSLIFKPIEIEIDEKIYQIENLNTKKLLTWDKGQKDFEKNGDIESLTKQLKSLIPDIPDEIVGQLDVRDIREVFIYIVEKSYDSQRIEGLKKKQPNLLDNKSVK